MLHKIVHNEVAIDPPIYIEHKKRHLRNHQKSKFIELNTRTEAYRNSFYCRTIKDYNSLPPNILNIECTRKFRLALDNQIESL